MLFSKYFQQNGFMSIVSNNIKYLRRLNGLTQEQFARKIAIKRSLLGAYEEARANPNLTNLKNMAAAFGISVDQLLKNDLRKLRETPDMSLPLSSRPMTVSHSGQAPLSRVAAMNEPQPLSKIVEKFQPVEPEIRTVSRQVNLKPVNGEAFQTNLYEPAPAVSPIQTNTQKTESHNSPITESNTVRNQIPVFNNQYSPTVKAETVAQNEYPVIQWVSADRQNEYLANHQNPFYLNQLPSFQLPNLPSGYYRGFESGSDFPLANSLLIGTFVRNWFDIQTGKQYLFVLHNQGIVFRKAINQVKERGVLMLISDISTIANTEISLNDVLEVWEIKAFVSTQLPTTQPNLDRVGDLLDEAKREIERIGK